jgi:hypothetical protein
MKFNLTRYSRTFAFACMTLFTITIPTAWTGEVEDFVAKLKIHYKKTPPIKAFSLTQHYLEDRPYQAWDYQTPNRWTAFKVTEFDLEKKHYVENVTHHYTGGQIYDEVHFQNDRENFRYEKNGALFGKRVSKQSMGTFERLKNIYMMNLDFFAVKPLLEESNIAATIKLHQNQISEKTTLTHKNSDDKIIDYVFSDNPLRLVSINNKSRGRISIYDDYQTTNGLTFARSITKYYGGAKTPRFIKRIDHFDILEEIDPAKLQVPKEFGPIIPKSDRTLISQEIAPDLYLVTTASAWRNTLFKVNDNEIMVFGAPVSPKLAEETIKLILGKFPKKKITSVYVTHPHDDHIDGLPAYAKRGIVIHADAYSIAAIKAYPYFADDIATFKFQTIEHNQQIDGARFYVLENSHSKRESFVHFKDSGIIYQADFLEVAFDNTIAKIIPNYTKTFIDFVRREQLKFSRIVGHHLNNNISVEVMNKTYDANIM